MSLRMRLSLAFVFVVLAPLVLAVVLLGRAGPGFGRVDSQREVVAAAQAVAADLGRQCSLAQSAARRAAADAATSPQMAVADAVAADPGGFGAIVDGSGRVVASVGQLPGAAASALGTGAASLATLPSCRTPGAARPYAVVGRAPVAGSADSALVLLPLQVGSVSGWQALPRGGLTLVSGRAVVSSSVSGSSATTYAAAAAGLADGSAHRVSGRLLAAASPAGFPAVTAVVSGAVGIGVTSEASTLLAVLAAAVVLAVGFGWQLARMTTRPLTALALAARRIADGDLDTPVPDLGGGDEVSQLAGAFDEMTGELRRSIGALQDSRDELRRNLARLGETLSGTHDLNRILHVICETAMTSVRAQAGAIYLPHSGGGARGDLFQRVGFGVTERGAAKGSRVRLGEGVLGMVALNGTSVRGRIGTGVGELAVSPDEPSGRNMIAVPLRASGRVTGVLGLYDKDGANGPASFDRGDLETIQTFASQATVAIDNVLLHQEAQRLSITDGLTGLWNYRYFTMTFAKEIERSSRFGRPLALLLLDLDKFKDVNDTYGHQRGDSVLIELATRVKGEIREVDTLARYGGEEFVLVLPETDLHGAAGAAQRICEVVRHRPFAHEGEEPLQITVSVGVSVFPAHGSTAATLLRNADTALYAAKDSGRDAWRMATDLEVIHHD